MSTLDQIVKELSPRLTGRCINPDEAALLVTFERLKVPPFLIDLMRAYPLVGASFELSQSDDLSNRGADLEWMTPAGILSEATEFYPGIAAIPEGFLPFAKCLRGSGDPYFLPIGAGAEDPPVVRISHEAVDAKMQLRTDEVEQVMRSLSELMHRAVIY